jgi:hypothetical protein
MKMTDSALLLIYAFHGELETDRMSIKDLEILENAGEVSLAT